MSLTKREDENNTVFEAVANSLETTVRSERVVTAEDRLLLSAEVGGDRVGRVDTWKQIDALVSVRFGKATRFTHLRWCSWSWG